MAAFWQDCEVSVPNKPVPIPRSMLFRGATKQKVSKLSFKHCASFKNTEESTSTGSTSQRSENQEETLCSESYCEGRMMNKTNQATILRNTPVQVYEMIDEDPDFGDLQRCEEVAAINAF